MITIFRTDDTDANGKDFITAVVNNPNQKKLSKILFSVNAGQFVIPFTDPNNFASEQIILKINFSGKETAQMKNYNIGQVVTFDMEGKQETCREYVEWAAVDGALIKWTK